MLPLYYSLNNNNNNAKRLWSGGYNISGSKLNLWINSCSFLVFIARDLLLCSILAAGRRAYPAKIRPSTAMLIRGLIVDIDRNLSKIKEKHKPTIVRPLESTRPQ